jgi:hypothetical protein
LLFLRSKKLGRNLTPLLKSKTTDPKQACKKEWQENNRILFSFTSLLPASKWLSNPSRFYSFSLSWTFFERVHHFLKA